MLLQQEHTVMVRQTSKWGQILLLTLVGLGASTFLTAWLYRLDEVVTVQGRLVPKEGGVEIKSPLAGEIDEVLVKNGEKVRKGQILIKYDVDIAKSDNRRIKTQIELEETKLEEQLKIRTRENTLNRNIDLTKDILKRLKPLEEKGNK